MTVIRLILSLRYELIVGNSNNKFPAGFIINEKDIIFLNISVL
jgi:hypothetical protein